MKLFAEYSDIVSVDEISEMLKIGRNQVYQLLKTGQIKSIRTGRRYIVTKYAVAEFVFKDCHQLLWQASLT